MKIFVVLLALFFNMHLQAFATFVPKGFNNSEGYKNLKFGMDTNTVHLLVSKAANTTSTQISAELIDTMILTKYSEALKYYDAQYKLVYIFFFEYSELYRIDIATYSGGYLDSLEIENPVSISTIQNIISSINMEYGKRAKHEREYRVYNGKDFVRDTYLWSSDISSISFIVNPSISTLDKEYKHYMYRLTYYSDSLVRRLRSNSSR